MPRTPRRFRSLRLETLEDRQLLATLPDGFEEAIVGSGLTVPTSMTFTPDGRILVAEKSGDVRVIQDGVLLPTPMLSVPVVGYDEMGLESIEVDPNFAQNGYVYVYYSRTATPLPVDRLSRFQISTTNPNVVDPASETVLVDGIVAGNPGFHNGGMLHFGAGGMLFLGVGDTVKPQLVQDLGSLQGKILRIHPSSYPNIIPTDNPFVNTPGARPEIWAYGFRNPFTGAIHPTTNELFVNDVGLTTWEEINRIQSGKNYGWPLKEGVANTPALYADPIYTYGHDPVLGGSITGGEFYTGGVFPADYQDDYFFADYALGFIRRFDPATNQVFDFATDPVAPVDLDVGADGNLYWLSLTEGLVRRVSYTTGNRAPEPVSSATPTSGLSPLTVSFSAAASEDPDEDPLTYLWDFGDGTTSTLFAPSHTYTTEGTYQVILTASDGIASASALPLTIIVGDIAPNSTIIAPLVTTTYRAGDTVQFAGDAVDRFGVPLPDSAFEWSVVFHHRSHSHPFIDSIPGVRSGSFNIPLGGEPDAVQFYRVILKATNSAGISTTRYVDIQPLTSPVTLTTSTPGLSLLLDNRPLTTPNSFIGVENFVFAVEAPDRQLLGSTEYAFQSWSNGAARVNEFHVPTQDGLTITANYLALANEASLAASPRPEWYVRENRVYNVSVTNLTTSTWLNTGTNAVVLEATFGGGEPVTFALPQPLAPNATVSIPIAVTASGIPGTYTISHRMKQGSVYLRGFDTDSAVVSGLAATYVSSPPTAWNREDVKTYSITLTNTGTETWSNTGSQPVNLGVYFSGSSDEIDTWPSEPARYALPQPVSPGASVTLTINVQSPTTPGNFILRHRLVKENIGWFQPLQKTSVTISNVFSYAATYGATPATQWNINELKTYNITLTNTGSEPWVETGTNAVKLGVYFAGDSDVPGSWPVEPVRYQLPRTILPGESVTLAISVQAPLTAGTYTLRHRMVKEGVTWFSSMQKSTVNVLFVPALVAQYSVTPPTQWNREDEKTYSITITNTGSEAWSPTGTTKVQLGVYFGGTSDAVGAWPAEPKRFAIPRTIQPGESFTLPLTVRAPATGGNYVLRHRMVKEMVSWFPAMAKTNVTVSNLYSLAASYVVTAPTQWSRSEFKTYNITITNTGALTWNSTGINKVQLGVYFGTASDAVGAWTVQPARYALTRNVLPGESITLSIRVRAPATAGAYILRHRMVMENVSWFTTMQKTNVNVI